MSERKTTIKCPLCKKKNPREISFCQFCRYPIKVKKINALTKKELSICLSGLLEVMAKIKRPLFKNPEIARIYDELLSVNWLRPESALFRFIEAKILLGFKNKYLKYPLLDLGCGEGLFTAILFGGRINKNYDAFESIDFGKRDVYNSYTKLPEDFFTTKPSAIGFGVDIKKNAVKKAQDLAVYDEVKVGDIRELPFRNESFNSVFSNMIDDIKREDLNRVFKEAHRVLRKNGYFVFTTPTKRFRKFLFYYNKAQGFKRQGDISKYSLFLALDRGRSEWEPRPLSLWPKLFRKTSFQLVKYVEYGNKNMLEFWDTGFRHFFYYLMNLRNVLRENNLYLPVKRIYLEIMRDYLFKYTENQIRQKGAFAIVAAQKNGDKNRQ